MVTGSGATKAGLLMLPLWVALLVSSTVSGQLVSKTGRYKIFPLAGTVVVGAALAAMSTMTADTSVVVACVYVGVMGVGLGMSSQILVLIVQNTFPAREVGTATASNSYFRQVGASLGSAVVGTVFASRLTDLLAGTAGPAGGTGDVNALTPDAVRHLPAAAHDVIVNAYSEALTPVFRYLTPLVGVAVVLLALITEQPLATTIDHGSTESTESTEPAMTEPAVG
jgi:MFS family permease